jgi:hypothetical protein
MGWGGHLAAPFQTFSVEVKPDGSQLSLRSESENDLTP